MKYIAFVLCFTFGLAAFAQQAKRSPNSGHSHNDYNQHFPFYEAYYAGMGSVEADVFLKDGQLLVAHNEEDTDPDKNLEALYLTPIAKEFRKNSGHIYADTSMHMQLLIDIKENHQEVLTSLVKSLQPYLDVFDQSKNPNAVKVLISGDVPPAEKFKNYPLYIFFDGRPSKTYTAEQLERVGMISESISNFSTWNGKGTPTPSDLIKLKKVVASAHQIKKPFRFWGTRDNPNSWKELEKIGVDWIGTDHPTELKKFYGDRPKTEFNNHKSYHPYTPRYQHDGASGKADHVILLIGDGMGLAQIQAGLSANFGDSNLAKFKHIGFSRTEASNSDFTDSAAGATAMATGKKTNNRYIAVDSSGKPIKSLTEVLSEQKIKVGVISNGDITDATPAAFYAHQSERDLSQAIAADLVNSPIEILVGSNRESFTDGKNKELLSTLKSKGFAYSQNLDEFKTANSGKQLVLLDDSVTRRKLDGRGEMLKIAVRKTIELLRQNKKGFFLMAEGAQIDHGGHANDLPFVITEQHDFDQLVGDVLRFADEDEKTLVIVTADHETGGLSLLDADYKKGYVRGNFSTNDHTNIMVPVFAYGPGAQHFSGIYPNTEIYQKILAAFYLKN